MPRRPTPQKKQTAHLTMRCINKQFLFNLKNNFHHIVSWINSLPCCYNIQVHHVLLMSNHIHMLVTPSEDNMGFGMQYCMTNLSKYLNFQNSRRNHMFVRPYNPTIIRSERHLINVIRYIYQNPVRAGMVNSPFEYKYSSLGFYAGYDNARFILQPEDYTRELFSEGIEGRHVWLKHVVNILSDDDVQIMRSGLKKSTFKFTEKQMRFISKQGTSLTV